MAGSAKAHYDGIKAFSETDQTKESCIHVFLQCTD